MLELCRYIVRNPVTAGVDKGTADWPWSSYRETAGTKPKSVFTTIDRVLEQFGGSGKRYVDYVAGASLSDSPLAAASGSNVLGGDVFQKEVQKLIVDAVEIPISRKKLVRRTLGEIGAGVESRDAWMSVAYREHGYTMREIADFAGDHYSQVSNIIKAWEGS